MIHLSGYGVPRNTRRPPPLRHGYRRRDNTPASPPAESPLSACVPSLLLSSSPPPPPSPDLRGEISARPAQSVCYRRSYPSASSISCPNKWCLAAVGVRLTSGGRRAPSDSTINFLRRQTTGCGCRAGLLIGWLAYRHEGGVSCPPIARVNTRY